MIYGHIWDAKTAAAAFHNVKDVKPRFTPWLKSYSRKPCACFQPRQLPSYVQHQAVGLQMAREVATAYYKAMPPERLGQDIGRLRAFLTRDHFQLGIVPAEHIRHIRIEIGLALRPVLTEIGDETEGFSSEDLRFIQRSLAKLDLIPKKAGFRFTVALGDDVEREDTAKALEAMRSSYEKFKQTGMTFRVYGYPSYNSYRVLRIDRYYRLSKNSWWEFVEAQHGRRGEYSSEHPLEDDEPDEYSWLDSSTDQLELEGHDMSKDWEPGPGDMMGR